jgi:hypothetical protein
MHDVRVSIPCTTRQGGARAPGSVTSLVTGQPVASECVDGTLSITVPRLELFEALQIA